MTGKGKKKHRKKKRKERRKKKTGKKEEGKKKNSAWAEERTRMEPRMKSEWRFGVDGGANITRAEGEGEKKEV